MDRPALVDLVDDLVAGLGPDRRVGQDVDGGVEVGAVMVRQRDADIERIAHDIDGARRQVLVHHRIAEEHHRGVVGLDEDVVRLQPAHRQLRPAAHPRHVDGAPFRPVPLVLGPVPVDRGIADRQVGDLVDVVGFVRVAEQVVQERPHPGVARLRIAGQPDDLGHCPLPRATWRSSRRQIKAGFPPARQLDPAAPFRVPECSFACTPDPGRQVVGRAQDAQAERARSNAQVGNPLASEGNGEAFLGKA